MQFIYSFTPKTQGIAGKSKTQRIAQKQWFNDKSTKTVTNQDMSTWQHNDLAAERGKVMAIMYTED